MTMNPGIKLKEFDFDVFGWYFKVNIRHQSERNEISIGKVISILIMQTKKLNRESAKYSSPF